jgi:predicted signal transduction protein with EAL and GGDEF domain
VDVVARFGGDEFLVVLPSTHFAGSVTVAERIFSDVVDRPFTVDSGRSARVSLSVGVALYPSRDVRTKDALLRAADSALSSAKREGGGRICVFQQQNQMYTPVTSEVRSASNRPRTRSDRPANAEETAWDSRTTERPPRRGMP